jgi:hypothetical protein
MIGFLFLSITQGSALTRQDLNQDAIEDMKWVMMLPEGESCAGDLQVPLSPTQ